MGATKFTFDTHFDTGVSRTDAEKRSRRSYSADEIEAIRHSAYGDGQSANAILAQQAVAASLSQVSAAVHTAISTMDAEIEAIRAEAADLALACARKLAGAALAHAPAAEVTDVLRLALHEAIAEPRIIVKVAPALADEIKHRATEVAADEGYEGRIQFAPDAALTGADCRIEWKGGGIERNLAAIEHALTDLILRRFPPKESTKE